jgi:hypothetical protein
MLRATLLCLLSLAAAGLQLPPLAHRQFTVAAMKPPQTSAWTAAYYSRQTMPPQMMAAKKPKNSIGGYSPDKPWSKAQGVALYAFVYALIGFLIAYRQANPVGGLPGVE